MSQRIISVGSIIPLGDGLTGKSVLTQLLISKDRENDLESILKNTKKSLNIEMEFLSEKYGRNGNLIDVSVQFYVFPGQRQKYKDIAPTFDEILDIFNFLPALKNLSVLLLVYDTTRIESLKSLESWLSVALIQEWIKSDTRIALISNKIDLQDPDDNFLDKIKIGIQQEIKEKIPSFDLNNIQSFKTSCIHNHGINELKSFIIKSVALNGKKIQK